MSNKKEKNTYGLECELLRDFARYPDTKASANRFVAIRLRELNRRLNLETAPKKKAVIKKIIKIYKGLK